MLFLNVFCFCFLVLDLHVVVNYCLYLFPVLLCVFECCLCSWCCYFYHCSCSGFIGFVYWINNCQCFSVCFLCCVGNWWLIVVVFSISRVLCSWILVFVMMVWYFFCVLFVGFVFRLFYFLMFDLVVLRFWICFCSWYCSLILIYCFMFIIVLLLWFLSFYFYALKLFCFWCCLFVFRVCS